MYALTTLTTWHKYLSMDGRTDGMADGKVISQTNAHYREKIDSERDSDSNKKNEV